MCSPRAFSFFRRPSGSGNTSASQVRSVRWLSFIQKQSKWNTLRGMSRWAMPSMKDVTVFSS